MIDLTFAMLVAPLDEQLSSNDRHVLSLINRRPHSTLDALCTRTRTPKPYIFYSVARLEELGYIPEGLIR